VKNCVTPTQGWQAAVHLERSCNEFDPFNWRFFQTILSMEVWNRVMNLNPQGHAIVIERHDLIRLSA
jgi:hypothetical protein